MARLKIKIIRNLRREILRGHPWVYREAIEAPRDLVKAGLARVFDAKGDLGWAMYDPHGPLALRILTLGEAPPSPKFLGQAVENSLKRRQPLPSESTNCYRGINGEGDGLPGLICDVYGSVAIIQYDGTGPGEFWREFPVAEWILGHAGILSVAEKNRRGSERTCTLLAGEEFAPRVRVRENDAHFLVDLERGQKTGFFLDQRDNRHFVRGISAGLRTLNLFSYTGGFSIGAGLGQARAVTSVDIARGAIETCGENWALNGLNPSHHRGVTADVAEFLQASDEHWDHVIVDPPSMGHAEATKEVAIAKYTDIFARAAKRVVSGGRLSLSSCSSHVTFEDFQRLITESLARVRRRGFVLRVSGQAADHPFPHAAPELRYLKFVHLILN